MPIPASQAKNQFGDLLMQAQAGPVFIEKHGKIAAVVISKKVFDQYQEARLALEHLLGRQTVEARAKQTA